VADRHADHDLLLVAAFAAGDLEGAELGRANGIVAACGECATLAADLQAIARATAEVRAARRPRDFFVRPADAERLRPRGLRRLAAMLAAPRRQLVRPLASGLMMVGFAGLVIASLPGLSQTAGGSPSDLRSEAAASATPAADIQAQPGEPASTGAEFFDEGSRQGRSVPPAAGGPGSAPTVQPDSVETGRDTAAVAGPSALLVGSLVLVALGAALFLVSLLRTGFHRS
jgi:hypothetical protein